MTLCKLCGGDTSATPAARWVLELQLEWPSQNRLGGKSSPMGGNPFAARSRYKKIRDRFELAIRCAASVLNVPKAAGKRRVTITRLWASRQRAYDYGNLVGGAKPLVDAIKAAGLLVDDSPKWLESYYRQAKSQDGVARILIEIEEF